MTLLGNRRGAPGNTRTASLRRRSPRRKLFVAVLFGLGAIALLTALDATWVATTAGRELRAARDRLEDGAEALLAGRLDDARVSFRLARTSADRAAGALGHPAAAVGRVLPVIGDDVSALGSLADAAEAAAEAGQALAHAADLSGWNGSTVPGLATGGSVDTGAISSAAPDVRAAAGHLRRAEESLEPVETDGLLAPVEQAVLTARRELASRDRLVLTAAMLSELLPGFLGDPEPRRYLLIMQNLSDPRGSGGFPGSYGLLSVVRGRLRLETLAPTTDLGTVAPVEAPPVVARRYARFGALTHFTATTYSPDFPTSARLLLTMWEASGRPPLGGVIAVDPVWMSGVLSAVGPVSTAWPERLTASNVTEVLGRETFETNSQDALNVLQGLLAEALWTAILDRPLPARAFADAMALAARERHLQVYSVHPEEQRELEQLGVAGEVELGDDPLMVAWDGGVASRAGYFAQKDVRYEATLGPDGSAQVTVMATLTNLAPAGPPSILLGPVTPNDVPGGYYAAFVNVYLPRTAERIQVSGGTLQLVEQEFGGPVVLGLIGAPSGGSETLLVSYRVSGLVVRSGDGYDYRLDVLPLPALNPDRFEVTVALPDGAEVIARSSGIEVTGSTLTWAGTPTTPQHLWVRFDVPE